MCYLPLNKRCLSWVDRGGIIFSLTVPLIEKGQKRNQQTTKRYQQAKYPDENQNYVCICHITHLPSMYPDLTKYRLLQLGRLPPCHGLFRTDIISYIYGILNKIFLVKLHFIIINSNLKKGSDIHCPLIIFSRKNYFTTFFNSSVSFGTILFKSPTIP